MKEQEKQNNKYLIIFLIFISIVGFFTYKYLSSPSGNHKKEKISFSEQLEQRFAPPKKDITQNVTVRSSKKKDILPPVSLPSGINSPSPEEVNSMSEKHEPEPVVRSILDYNKLLDSLVEYPSTTGRDIQNIVDKLVLFKGYPEGIVKVVATDIDQSRAKTHENYMVANFDFSNGYLNISQEMLYKLPNKAVIAILAHELDHFDKVANVCKSMGIDKFQELFNKNKVPLNTRFWSKACMYANDKKFDPQLYQDALARFIDQNKIELTSSYSDFYRLAENMRNPLEVSAYDESDYVYNHYKIKLEEGPMKRITNEFNSIDWNIYNFLNEKVDIRNERIPIFDMYFSRAILKNMPQFKYKYDDCVNNKNGNLTDFWVAYENSVSSFYQKGKMDKNTYDKIYALLVETENQSKIPLANDEIALALKYKINTLLPNLVYPNAVKHLRSTIVDYLKYANNIGYNDPAEELKCILTLICIDNNLEVKNKSEKISLYDLIMPAELSQLYGAKQKKGKFLFIYNLKEFEKQRGSKSETETLIDLLNKNRLDVRVSE